MWRPRLDGQRPFLFIMRRHDHSAPFDHDLAEASDIAQEFWGGSRSWQDDRPSGRVGRPTHADDTTGAIRAIRDGVTAFRPQRVSRHDPSGSARRTRTHGTGLDTPPVVVPPTPEETLGELASGPTRNARRSAPAPIRSVDRFDWDFDATSDQEIASYDDIPLTPRSSVGGRLGLGGVDPLLARFGALVLVGVLLVPVVLALRPSETSDQMIRSDAPALEQTAAGSPVAGSPVAGAPAPPAEDALTPIVDAASAQKALTVASSLTDESSATNDSNDQERGGPIDEALQGDSVEEAAVSALDQAATADVEAERLIPECSNPYTVTPGDSWYAIAGAADVSPGALMSQNGATTDTVIAPGDEICLPPGASVSATPTTAPSSTTATPISTNTPTTAAPTAAASTTAASTAAAPTTAAPTTAAPTTNSPTTAVPAMAASTTAAPAQPATVEQIKQMIRDTWPADQHEMAFFIANRESKFDPRADNNFCCYGVFQIYFDVHEGWLDEVGVHQASDLFAAEKNIAAAYRIYQRAGGWGPWGY